MSLLACTMCKRLLPIIRPSQRFSLRFLTPHSAKKRTISSDLCRLSLCSFSSSGNAQRNLCQNSVFLRNKSAIVWQSNFGCVSAGLLRNTDSGYPILSRDVRIRTIHFSPRCPAHPMIWPYLRSGLKFLTPLISRVFRRWWFKLPEDRRRKYYEFFMKHRQKLIYFGIGGLVSSFFYYVIHIDRTPMTNRRRFITLSSKQFDEISKFESEKVLVMFQRKILPKYDHRVRTVTKVVRKLLQANADLPQVGQKEWRVFVVDSDQLDTCFVLPHGEIFVFTSFLKKIENLDQLAIVLGHEISHAILGHGTEQLSWVGFLDWFIILGMAAIWAVIPVISLAFVTNYFFDKVVDLMLKLPYSRTLELEADQIGIQLAAKACFDIRESYAFWTNMCLLQKTTGAVEFPDFFSTHPSHGDRAKRLDMQIPETLKLRESFNCPPLKRVDPRILADQKARLVEQELAVQGRV